MQGKSHNRPGRCIFIGEIAAIFKTHLKKVVTKAQTKAQATSVSSQGREETNLRSLAARQRSDGAIKHATMK